MNVRRSTLAFTLLMATAGSALAADKNANEFTLINRGRTVGKASYSIDKVKEGFRVRSHFSVSLSANDLKVGDPDTAVGPSETSGGTQLGGTFVSEYRIAPDGNFVSGYLQDSTQTILSFTPTKTREAITIGRIQGGASAPSADMPMPAPDFTFAPNFDPGALQIFMTTALAHPHKDLKYVVLIPSLVPKQGPSAAYIGFQPGNAANASGTLDGKTVELKKYTLKFYKGSADVYLDETGNLMQADMGNISTRYVRAKFTLTEAK